MQKFKSVTASNLRGDVMLELLAFNMLEDVSIRLTPELALEAAENLIKAARKAMAK